MAIWELIVDALSSAHRGGQEWLSAREIIQAVEGIAPETNDRTIRLQVKFRCINDPSKRNGPGLQYLKNPLFITDNPAMYGKRYRLLSEAERNTFLANPREDLDQYSYTQVLEWLQNSATPIVIGDGEDTSDEESSDDLAGPALLELHLQDYLFRNWKQHFPDLDLYKGTRGREFVTTDPGVGIIDFLCTDRDGNFVVIETKRDRPDRKAIGQVLGYMGWVSTRLAEGRRVSGILIANSGSDSLRMAIAAVPNLELRVYELSFAVHREQPQNRKRTSEAT